MQNRRTENKPLLAVENLVQDFSIDRRTTIQAVSGISLGLAAEETLGLVGESGCGKSTLARVMARLLKPTSGRVLYQGQDMSRCRPSRLRQIRPEIQMIFQDATASLNPGRTIGRTIEEPLRALGRASGPERIRQARAMMRAVGLDPDLLYRRYPFELSQGQCQRVSLARALIPGPRVLICDEPVSSLDVSVQAQILNLLETLKSRFNLSLLFISHDLAVVKNISDRVAVMYLGKLVEIADAEALYRQPRHPYTGSLLAAVPTVAPCLPKPGLRPVRDARPSPASPPSGCRFHPRCPVAQPRCSHQAPVLSPLIPGHAVACHFPIE